MVLVRKEIGSKVYVYNVTHGRWHYLGREKPIEEWVGKIHCGDAYQLLPLMPSESVDCVVTSPPYYGLRIYDNVETIFDGDPSCEHEWHKTYLKTDHKPTGKQGTVRGTIDRQKYNYEITSNVCIKCGAWKGQLGLEPSWKMYVQHLVELFREVKRVLKKTGSFWLNIGDTYFGGGHGGNTLYETPSGELVKSVKQGKSSNYVPIMQWRDDVYKQKCLMGIPWRIAFALIEDGWILRNAVIWYKPNAMPSSVKDRLTHTYEFLFHFVKSKKYYYNLDNIREPPKIESVERWERALRQRRDSNVKLRKKLLKTTGVTVACMVPKWFEYSKHDLAVGRVGNFSYTDPLHVKAYNVKGKNPGDALLIPSDFWSIHTKPFKGAHFAVFPPELPLRPILASCPPDGVVLDPLAGSGTVAYTCELINHGMWDEFRIHVNQIARKTRWSLKWILIEINPEYCKLAEERLKPFRNTIDRYF
jgi:site-specific DNA-methyltransferase (cytosine-N4-specific)